MSKFKMCERCNDDAAKPGFRFCERCKKIVIREIREANKPIDSSNVRTLSRHGTEEIGRSGRNCHVVGMQTEPPE